MSDFELNQLLLGELEVTENVDPTPTPAANAILCGELMPKYSPQELQRKALESGLTEPKMLIGRELVDLAIAVDLRGAGTVGNEPDWGPLVEICGYTKRVIAAKTVGAAERAFGNSGGPSTLAVTSGGTFTGPAPRRYLVTVTLGGASGVATCGVVCLDDTTQNSVGNVITTATPINLGDEGATITFTFASGNLVLGDAWLVHCYLPCVAYATRAPADAKTTMTFYHYLGKHLVKVHGARADFSLAFPAGEMASAQFSVRGRFGGLTDVDTPAGDYWNKLIPPVVESAGVLFGSFGAGVIPELGFTSGNKLSERPDVNSEDGLKGLRYGRRDPRWSATVEAELEATHPFWANLRARTEFPLNAQAGSVAGNIVQVWIRRASTLGNDLANKENILHYGLSGQIHAVPGQNDNIEIMVR